MKAVYISIVVLALVMAVGQYANASEVLDKYYSTYAGQIMVHNAHQVKSAGVELAYGDETVGYYATEEEYHNMYDPAITAEY